MYIYTNLHVLQVTFRQLAYIMIPHDFFRYLYCYFAHLFCMYLPSHL